MRNKLIAEVLIKEIEEFLKDVENKEQQNEQWFINFLDKINTLSVKY